MSVLEYLNTKVTAILKPSPLGGIGFFAVKDIEVGESVFEPWYGESGIYSITQEELFKLPIQLQKNLYETFHHKIDYIDKDGNEQSIPKEYGKLFFPLERGYHWIYLWPKMFMNSGLRNGNVNSNDNILPVVVKRIKEGDEILGNYGSQFKTTPKNFL
jgi:hypothetical protein